MAGADGRLITPRRRSIAVGDLDLAATLGPLGTFRGDPTHRWGSDSFARAVLTPDGPGTLHLRWSAGNVEAEAWGPGAAWLLEMAPRWCGLHDDPSEFDPSSPRRLAELWRRSRSWRLAASGVIWQELAFTILGQRVTTVDATRSWAQLCRRFGEPAPGPCGLRLPPAAAVIAGLGYVDLHRHGIERRRAEALRTAARNAGRLEEAATMPVDDALQRLSALPGLGIWTATATASVSHGHPDVVVLGDYGIPTMVSYAFTGCTRRVGDERMLELLEPFAGQRHRVVRLLYRAGLHPPRRAPRARNPRIAEL